MQVRISRWGNSLAVRLPKKLAEQLRNTPEVDTVMVADGPVHRVGGAGPSTMTLRIESHGAELKYW